MRIFFLLILVIIGLSGKSQDKNSITKKPTLINISSVNDSFNGSFAANRDDLRTYGFEIGFYRDKFQLNSSYYSYTNRSRQDTSKNSRNDELKLWSSYQIFEINGISFHPVGGLIFSGNLGGAEIQNNIHESTNEPLVHLPYDYDSPKTALLLGLAIKQKLNLKAISPICFLENELEFDYGINYATNLSAGSKIFWGNKLEDHLSFSVAYEINQSENSNTLSAVFEKEQGLVFGFNQDISFFTLGYEIYPFSGYGYGRIGVNLLKTRGTKQYKESDIIVDFKMLFDRAGYASNYKWTLFQIQNHDINASFGHVYGTYTGTVIESHPQARGQFIQLNLGLESYLNEIKPKFQVNPYFGAGLGVKAESTFSGSDPNYRAQSSIGTLFYADLGIRIGGPINFISRNSLIGIVIGDMYTLPFKSKNQMVYNQKIIFLQPKNSLYTGLSFAVDF